MKYRNKPFTDSDGLKWDSQAEYRRWCELKLLERAGEITNLSRQIRVPVPVNGIVITTIKPDFAYFENGKRIYEDYKGFVTRDWALRWKLAKAVFPSIEWRVSK